MLEINIVGSANTGKSAIAELISRALEEYGITATVVPFLPGEYVVETKEDMEVRLESIATKQTAPLKINEIQEPRRNSEEL